MYKVSSRSSPRTVVVGVALVVFFFSGHGYRGRLIELQCELGRRERGSVSALKIEMATSNLRFSNKMIQNFLQATHRECSTPKNIAGSDETSRGSVRSTRE